MAAPAIDLRPAAGRVHCPSGKPYDASVVFDPGERERLDLRPGERVIVIASCNVTTGIVLDDGSVQLAWEIGRDGRTVRVRRPQLA